MSDLSQRLSQMSPLKLAFAAQKMRAKLAVLYAEPIAVVGLGCRFPGGANNPEQLWRLLSDGVDAIREVPEDRFPIDAFYDPDPDAPGKMSTRFGGFVEHLREFDPQFFGISPREAGSLDPQHRLLLEVSWEALENAGLAPDQLAGSQTGVFIGICGNDYQMQLRSRALSEMDAYMGTGTFNSVASGRLSYFYGFQGPSISLDTACSSSLVAIHLAVSALRNGECNLALVGGVNRIYSPDVSLTFSKSRMLAPDGRCKSFDAAANGYVRSEGCGVVVLKRLSDALTDRDNIVALVRGSAVNQDGRVSGLTVPNGPAQQAVIRQALENGGVAASQVSYIEAHGTGTSLGDPIEMGALKAVFAQRSHATPLQVGSLKTNIGHLEGAAGIAGFMKVVLSLKHKQIAPHLHFNEPSPYIGWDEWPVEIPTQLATWNAERRIAGVSSFGFSGTNAHVVLEEAPQLPQSMSGGENKPTPHLFTLSARSQEALIELAGRYASALSAHPEHTLADICFTAQTGRDHFHSHVSRRLSLVTSSRESLIEELAVFSNNPHRDQAKMKQGRLNPALSIAFLFTGQGSQYVGMGRDLYQSEPIFRKIIDQCDNLLRPRLKKPLLDVLYRDRAAINQTAYTQPALFALEYALAKLWDSWGIKPTVVIGHSVGEYVAACLAGVFSLEDGLKLIAERGRLMQNLPQNGAMVAVFASEAEVKQALKQTRAVSIAAINGRQSVVISGERQAVRRVVAALEGKGIKTKPLTVSHAFHSALMEPMLRRFERVARQIRYSAPKIEIISNVTGEAIGQQIANAQYWVRHVRQPVRFMDGMQALAQKSVDAFLEIGPSSTLLSMGRRCLADDPTYADYKPTWLPALRPSRQGKSERSQLLNSLGELYVQGVKVDFVAFNAHHAKRRRRVVLPTYPFQRQPYWVEGGSPPPPSPPQHWEGEKWISPLLGERLQLPFSNEIRFAAQWNADSPAYLGEHKLYEKVIVPASSHIAMLLSAAHEAYGSDSSELLDLYFPQALVLEESQSVQLILNAPNGSLDDHAFQLVSLNVGAEANNNQNDEAAWTLHSSGRLSAGDSHEFSYTETVDIDQLYEHFSAQTVPLLGDEFYQRLWQDGYHLGPAFCWVEKLWFGENEVLGQLEARSLDEITTYQLAPGLIDSFLQVFVSSFLMDGQANEQLYIPFHIERFHFVQRPTSNRLWCHAQFVEEGQDEASRLVGDLRVFDENGQLIIEATGLEARQVSRNMLLQTSNLDDWFYDITWEVQQPEPIATLDAARFAWLILADQQGVGAALAQQLERNGQECTVVYANGPLGAAVATLWEEFKINNDLPCRGIIHLWGLDGQETHTASGIQQAIELSCGSVLHLVQTLANDEINDHEVPTLWIVTQGAQAVTSYDTPQVAQTPLWGLGQVIALEHPDLWGGVVDLDPQMNPFAEVETLLEAISQPNGENQLAIRDGQRYAPRLRPYQAEEETHLEFDPNGIYLITGGLGGLGLQVARWMVEQGAKHLVLVARRAPESLGNQALELLAELQQDADVIVAQADVTEREQMAELLTNIKASMPPLRGIIHAAGVFDDGVLIKQDWARFEKVMAPKVMGTWHLHTLTADDELDFFVCFSSVASLLGSSGQANYAAANAFMDGVAHYRHAKGLPAQSINWGLWRETGAAVTEQTERIARERGWHTIAPQEGVQALGGVLSETQAAQVGIMPINWAQFFANQAYTPFFEAFQPQQQTKTVDLLQELAAAINPEARLEQYIRSEIARVLELRPEELEPRQRLFDLGLDSLMAVELKNSLEGSLARPLRATLLFHYPTLEALVDYLAQEILPTLELSPSNGFEEESKTTEVVISCPSGTTNDEEDDESLEDIAKLLAEQIA